MILLTKDRKKGRGGSVLVVLDFAGIQRDA